MLSSPILPHVTEIWLLEIQRGLTGISYVYNARITGQSTNYFGFEQFLTQREHIVFRKVTYFANCHSFYVGCTWHLLQENPTNYSLKRIRSTYNVLVHVTQRCIFKPSCLKEASYIFHITVCRNGRGRYIINVEGIVVKTHIFN